MVKERQGMINLEERLLKARVAQFDWLFKLLVKHPERDPDNPILHVAEVMSEFRDAVDEVKARFERLTLSEFQTQPKALLGWFQKRFRRAWLAQKNLAQLAELCDCCSPGVGQAPELRDNEDEEALDAFILDMQRRSDLYCLAEAGLNEQLYMQVSAIAAAQHTLYSAIVASVTMYLCDMLEHPEKFTPPPAETA